jgi:hypothetical protein
MGHGAPADTGHAIRKSTSGSSLTHRASSARQPERPIELVQFTVEAQGQASPPSASALTAGSLWDPDDREGQRVNWSETDQNSFIRPLVALCQEIIQLGGDDLGKGENRYLSPEVICLISRLRDFAQARIDTHPHRPDGSQAETIWESEVASRHRLETLIGLKETLAIGNPFALIGIAAFAFFEVCDSGFGHWRRHLLGAKSLLDYHCTCAEELEALSKDVTGLNAIISRLVWFDTIGAIGRGTSDMIFDSWHRKILDDDFFGIVGCPGDTFHLFARVAAGEMATDTPGILLTAMDQLLQLDHGGRDWDLSANVFRCAAALAVLTKVEDDRLVARTFLTAMIKRAVDQTCRMLGALQPNSGFYIHLAVPAYLAGINATTSEQCDAVRRYWHNCSHAGVRRYPDGLARCEDHWKAQGLDT